MRTPSTETPDPNNPPEEVVGIVEDLVFRSEQTGYTVCRVKTRDQSDPVTVVGSCATIWVGETLKATGRWVRHKQHGLQFQADNMTCVVPTSARGIERYLASGLIQGVGKVTAKRLVQQFGEDTLRIIEKESRRMEEVEGIGPIRRKLIHESWAEQKAVRDIMIFLQGHAIGTAQSARIFRQYGHDAIALVSENPYRLCADVWGIGFKTADNVAQSLGVPLHSETRARAGLIYTLQTMTEEGHCFCTEAELLLQAQALLDIPVEILATALSHEIARGLLVLENNKIYLKPLYEAEQGIAAKFVDLLRTPARFRPIVTDKAVPWAEQRMGISFAPLQSEALRTALSEKVSIITGGPGVGKTTIIRALVDVFGYRGLNVCLAAPTGRAAKRMEEATGHPACTLHRLLKFQPGHGGFDHDRNNPLEGDVFILDEVSMVDIPLMHRLCDALPDTCCLILVGDIDQLPSVGPGNLLRDLIESQVIPFQKLDTIFRQEHGGWIVRNAHNINHGEGLELPPQQEDSDFFFVECDDPEKTIQQALSLVTDRIPKRFGFDPRNEIQVLTPMRKNQLGAENLNVLLQEALNPSGPDVHRMGRIYRQNDRVMQIRNNYDKDVFNGDIGTVEMIDREEQILTVNYDDRRVRYDFVELDELVHAYACSIHKSQGSEYPAVVILISTQHYKLLQRNLLYTAITRGKKLVCLVGSSKAVRIAIHNNNVTLRRTTLRDRLFSLVRATPGT